MNIKELVKNAYENASRKGFWNDWYKIKGSKKHKGLEITDAETEQEIINNAIGSRLMDIVREVSEAQEALRKDDIDNFKEELADIVIRVASLAGGLEIDLESEVIKKIKKNKSRPYKHGKAF